MPDAGRPGVKHKRKSRNGANAAVSRDCASARLMAKWISYRHVKKAPIRDSGFQESRVSLFNAFRR